MTSQIPTIRTQATDVLASIDWATHQRRARAVALAVAVACYLIFLALRGAFRLGVAARSLWVKYDITAKLAAVVAALKAEFDAVVPLSVRVSETRLFLSATKAQLADFANSAKTEAIAITGK